MSFRVPFSNFLISEEFPLWKAFRERSCDADSNGVYSFEVGEEPATFQFPYYDNILYVHMHVCLSS